jgi:hypothetical protein
MKFWTFGLLIIAALALVGCQGQFNVERNPEGGADVTITLSESDINTAITQALSERENPLLRDPQVDLQPGQIVVSGIHDRNDGSGEVSGTLTATVTVQNGALLAQVTQANIQGVSLSDERIARFNERLAQNFGQRVNNQDGFTMQSVTITDSDMQIKFNIQQQEN